MAKTEVTQAQWRAVMGSNPSGFKGPNLPVETVSWDDAQLFIVKVNTSGILPPGWRFALPTEAQWEYASRVGGGSPDSVGEFDDVAWYDGNSDDKTHPVATKKANAWGLHDMHGNVWEWCLDRYDHSLSGGIDPKGATYYGDLRVTRGGSWGSWPDRCRAERSSNYPDTNRYDYLGFRLALIQSE
jgi:formylglycine-generating enzyme required for sulfatase activity